MTWKLHWQKMVGSYIQYIHTYTCTFVWILMLHAHASCILHKSDTNGCICIYTRRLSLVKHQTLHKTRRSYTYIHVHTFTYIYIDNTFLYMFIHIHRYVVPSGMHMFMRRCVSAEYYRHKGTHPLDTAPMRKRYMQIQCNTCR